MEQDGRGMDNGVRQLAIGNWDWDRDWDWDWDDGGVVNRQGQCSQKRHVRGYVDGMEWDGDGLGHQKKSLFGSKQASKQAGMREGEDWRGEGGKEQRAKSKEHAGGRGEQRPICTYAQGRTDKRRKEKRETESVRGAVCCC